jgi:hypothetical protein
MLELILSGNKLVYLEDGYLLSFYGDSIHQALAFCWSDGESLNISSSALLMLSQEDFPLSPGIHIWCGQF